MISNFSDFLDAAQKQLEPQRLLLMFAKIEGDGTEDGTENVQETSGLLEPRLCVDKLPEEILSFKQLVEEADSFSTDWNLILAAGIAGKDGIAPTSEEAEPYLDQMANALESEEDLSHYLIFDRQENLVEIEAA